MVETFFTEKRKIKKIIIAIVFIFLFNFTFSYLGNNVVFATEGEIMDDEEIIEEEGGGKLLLPIQSLILFLADATLELMQRSFIADQPVTITASADSESKIDGAAIAGIAIGAVVLCVACVVTYGAAAGIVGAVGTATAGATGALATAGTAAVALATGMSTYGGVLVGGIVFAGASVAGIVYSGDKLIDSIQGEYELPTIQYTPEEIFANRIPMFDINFFNPADNVVIKTVTGTINKEVVENEALKADNYEYTEENDNEWKKFIKALEIKNFTLVEKGASWTRPRNLDEDYGYYGNNLAYFRGSTETGKEIASEERADPDSLYSSSKQLQVRNDIVEEISFWVDDGNLYMFQHYDTPWTIDNEWFVYKYQLIYEDSEETINATRIEEYQSSSKILQTTVASMYKTLRTVAIVALLSILVYVGIRMVLSSASKDKAKYKQMLIDWLVAFILLFVLHYMMAFIIDISESLTNICNSSNIENVPIKIPNGTKLKDEKTGEFSERLDGEDASSDVWGTNFIGAIRFYAGLVEKRGYTMKGVMYTIMYLVLVIYTVMFTFQYMKRVLYMAFLTMIAPLVAITYPLDKINDGKAQGFNMWLKEYIFNALLQPIHYIIYVIIMGSVMNLVVVYPVYALVALGFMIPAEKFIRKMFGFEKAATVGGFGAAAGAAALMGGLQKLRHKPHGKGNDDNGAKGDKDNPNGKVRTISAMPDGPNNPGGGNGGLPGGNNIPSPGDPGFIGPLPYDRNSTLLGMPQQNNTNERYGQNQYDRLTTDYEDTQARVSNVLGENNNDQNFIGPKPYDENTTLATMPGSTVNLMDYATNNRQRVYGPMPYDSNSTLATMPRTNQRPNLFNRARGTVRRIGNSSFGQGVRAVGGHYKRRLDNRLRKAHPLRALRRGLTFGAGALTLGTIGLAAGIASGDPSKALQFTAAGAMAGGHLGQNLGETASNIVGLEGAARTFKAGALGSKYDELERAKYKRDFKNNVSNYDAAIKNVTAKGWKEMSKDGGIIDTALDYGINNVDDMSNIYKTQQKFMNDNGLSEEEAQDLAFKAYKLDQQFGDYSSNSKTQENLDKLLKAKGWTDDTQREQIKEGMLNTMRAYQKVSLDENIEEPSFDYTRMANQTDETQTTNNQEPLTPNLHLFGHQDTNNDDLNREEERHDRDEDRNSQPQETTIPMDSIPTDNQEEIARRANAESEANKAAVRQKEENRKIQEELEARAKADKKAERRARAETARQKSEQAKAKRKGMETKNGELGEPKASNAVDPDKRIIKPKTKDVNPISSDPGNNGNGPINTL